MADFFICQISAVNGRVADISIKERDDVVITDVPFLAGFENFEPENTGYGTNGCKLPKAGDTVVAIFENKNGRLGRGYIIGAPLTEIPIHIIGGG